GTVLAYATDITPVELLNDTNAERTKVGLAPLRLESRFNASSSDKANDMFTNNYWAHVSPTGVQPWHWFEQENYSYSYAGENLAKNFDTSAGVTQGWMNSQTHRDNLLNPNYVDVGFSVKNGTLTGEQTTLVVAHYGTVAKAPVAAATTPAPKSVAPTVLAATPQPKASVVPTPVSATTPAPTATPIAATPRVAPTTPQVTPLAKVEVASPTPTTYSFFNPLSASKSLSAGSKISLSLLAVLGIIMLLTHFTVWRRRVIHGFAHSYKLRAVSELAIIGVGIIIVIIRSFGSVT
ncbi:MAG: CAP domain-containing protein, partial [Candidatus Saccharibacteria bacterium]